MLTSVDYVEQRQPSQEGRFDGLQADGLKALELTQVELRAAFDGLPAAQRQALEAAARRVRSYHEAQKRASGESWTYRDEDGTLLGQNALTSSFLTIYLGQPDGTFTVRPDTKMPDGYDPRVRPWYKDGINANGPILTEPYIDMATNKMVISIICRCGVTIAPDVGP